MTASNGHMCVAKERVWTGIALLLFMGIQGVYTQTWVRSVTPAPSALSVSRSAVITAVFDRAVNPATLTSGTIRVCGSQSGWHTGVASYNAGTKSVIFDPDMDFSLGEKIIVTLTTGIQNSMGDPLPGANSWEFCVISNGTALFFPPTSCPTGIAPYALVAIDIENDGDLDLATANAGANTVSILRNQGNGRFVLASSVNVGTSPQAIVAGDFNFDGSNDLAVANNGSNTISILLNNGYGGFVETSTVGAGSNPAGLAIGDLDGDGDLDIVVASQWSNAVFLLINDGSGKFLSSAPISVGVNPSSIVVADLDGDRDLDIAVTNYGSGSLSVLLNNGVGAFSLKSSVTVGSNPAAIVAGDFNRDGDLDLAVAGYGSGKIYYLKNGGGGTFQVQSSMSLPQPPTGLACGDFDGDGDLDLLAVAAQGNQFAVLSNNSSASFTGGLPSTIEGGPLALSLGDFDGDNDLDFVTSNATANTVSFISNRNTTADISTSTAQLNFNVVRSFIAESKNFVIRNESGLSPLQITGINSSSAAFSVNPATGYLLPLDSLIVKVTFTPLSVKNYRDSLTVLSNDPGKPYVRILDIGQGGPTVIGSSPVRHSLVRTPSTDITVTFNSSMTESSFNDSSFSVFGEFSGRVRGTTRYEAGSNSIVLNPSKTLIDGEKVYVQFNSRVRSAPPLMAPMAGGYTFNFLTVAPSGSGVFQTDTTSAITAGASPFGLAAGDFNRDGYADLVVANSGESSISVFLANRMGGFSAPIAYPVGSGPQAVCVTDVDGDGNVDLVTANSGSNNISILRGNGAGVFGTGVNVTVGASPRAVAAADLDADGDMDLVVVNASSNTISILLNDGSGGFGQGNTVLVGSQPGSVDLEDLDNDGDMDIVVTNKGAATFTVLFNTKGIFDQTVVYATDSQPSDIATGDFDNDGDIDLAVVCAGATRVTMMINDGSGGFTAGARLTTQRTPVCALAHDFDGDGDIDLAVSNNGNSSISVFKNQGGATFGNAQNVTVLSSPRGLVGLDINAFGVMDLAVALVQVDRIAIVRNGVSIQPPGGPLLAMPAPGALNQPTAPTLRWHAVSGTVRYRLQVSTDPLFGTTVLDNSELVDTFKVVSGLNNSGRYYWRVAARNAAGVGAFAPAWEFKVIDAPPGAPILGWPAMNTTGLSLPLTLSWNSIPSVLSYGAQIAMDSLFTKVVLMDTSIATPFLQAQSLALQTKHFWRVRAKNPGGWGPYSAVWAFTTTLVPPTLLSPANKVGEVLETPTLSWSPVPEAILYRLQLATDSLFQSVLFDSSSITETSQQVGPLNYLSTYYWRVRGFNGQALGVWSAVGVFTTRMLSGVDQEEGIPETFSLWQNYPNPFNPSTTIKYGLPSDARVTLEVFDQLGHHVATIVNEEQHAGYHRVLFQNSTLSSGVYYYRIRANSFTEVHKCVLLK